MMLSLTYSGKKRKNRHGGGEPAFRCWTIAEEDVTGRCQPLVTQHLL